MPIKACLLSVTAFACAAGAQTVLVKPYVQPGNGATLDGTDVKVLTWLTDQKPGEFTVEFGVPGQPVQAAKVQRVPLDFAPAKVKASPKKPDVKGKAPEPAKQPATSIEEINTTATKESAPVIPE